MGGHTRVDPPAHPHKDAFAVSVHPGSIPRRKGASNVAGGGGKQGFEQKEAKGTKGERGRRRRVSVAASPIAAATAEAGELAYGVGHWPPTPPSER